MIYTLTTNPAIDMNINTSAPIAPSVVNRTFDAVYTPNGKGLNVSFVLRHYGVASTILGFFGGFSGRYIIDACKNERKIPVLPVMIDDITRVNVFLFDGHDEYKMVNEGSLVPQSAQDQLVDKIAGLCDLEVLSISGSLPKGVGPDLYHRVLQKCVDRQAKIVLDISHKCLPELLHYRPFLIKPNDEEIYDIFGWEIHNEADVVNVMDRLLKKGAQNVLLTLGDKGMYFCEGPDAKATEEKSNPCHIYFASVPPTEVYSSACAGDSSLGAFMAHWNFGAGDVEYAMKCACAVGADVVMSQGIGELARVDEFIKKAEFRQVR